MTGFWINFEGGDIPQAYIDNDGIKARVRAISEQITAASGDSDDLVRVISQQIMRPRPDEPADMRLLVAASVIAELAIEVIRPSVHHMIVAHGTNPLAHLGDAGSRQEN